MAKQRPYRGGGGLNIYAFVDNNPIDWFDILGERSNFAVDFSIPSTIPGLNGYVRGDFWKDDCCINGSLFIAAELAPPGFHHVGRLANRFNIHFELGARGGGRGRVAGAHRMRLVGRTTAGARLLHCAGRGRRLLLDLSRTTRRRDPLGPARPVRLKGKAGQKLSR